MAQKIIKIGSSIGITIPRKSAEELGLTVGDSVTLAVDAERKVFSIRPERESVRQKKITELTLNFIERYRKDLEALAGK